MGELSERLQIAASPQVVYDLVDDPSRFAEWQPYVTEVADLAGRPEGIGTSFMATYRLFGRRLLTHWVITGAEHGRLLETTGTTNGGWAHWRFTLEPVDGATMLSTRLEYELPGPLLSGPIALVAKVVLRRRLHETIGNLGRLAELEMQERRVPTADAQDAAVPGDLVSSADAPPMDAQTERRGAEDVEARPADDAGRPMVVTMGPRSMTGGKRRRAAVVPEEPGELQGRALGPARGAGAGEAGPARGAGAGEACPAGAKPRQLLSAPRAVGRGHDGARAMGPGHDDEERPDEPPIAAASRVRRG